MFKLVVLSCVLAAASASAIAPLGWAGAGWGGWAGHGLAAPLAAHWAAPVAVAAPAIAAAPVLGAYNYRGPLSLAPGQPANILAADGRPLDTLSVNLDRAAHYTARAVDGAHVLHKRSAVLAAAPVAWSHAAGLAVPAPLAAAPLTGAWGHAPWGHAGAWGAHVLHKRSAVLAAAPVAWSHAAGLAVPAPLAAAPLAGAWGHAPWGHAGAWGAHW